MRVSATIQSCITLLPTVCDYHSLLNIQKKFYQIKSCTQNRFFCSTIPAEKKKKLKVSTKTNLWPALWLAIQKEVISKPKQPSYKKKSAASKKARVKKRCEIQGGGHEKAVMVD